MATTVSAFSDLALQPRKAAPAEVPTASTSGSLMDVLAEFWHGNEKPFVDEKPGRSFAWLQEGLRALQVG